MNPMTQRLALADVTLPKKEKKTRSSVKLPDALWDRLDATAKATRENGEEGYTRDEVIEHFIKWAYQELEERGATRPPEKKKR